MQTFLPYPDFRQSVQCLDTKRLGKQRVECLQILKAANGGGGWANHPATRMWRNWTPALSLYFNECVSEWCKRGYKNALPFIHLPLDIEYPPWLGDTRLHASHRSNLLRKNPTHYGPAGWSEPPGLPYFWPSKDPAYVTLCS